ncbi:sugar phosphate isomerase/epimerase family protein [Sphingomonas tabacisoli]|uniref:Sugar phosphate isomerase/epimerase family protein n=1 Tax=Sphingomonas tabacisoli TaxID=2249466 RepID=A0ABW4I1J6_9SPHN
MSAIGDRPWLSLAPQSFGENSPQEYLRAAATSGFGAVGLRTLGGAAEVTAAELPSLIIPSEVTEIARFLDGEGLVAHEIEFVALRPDTQVADFEAGISRGAALGGRYLVTCSHDPDQIRAAENLAALEELCASHSVRALVEFVSYSAISSLTAAKSLLDTSRSGAGILVDALHFHRSGSDLGALDPELVPCLQLCDAPSEHPTETDRLIAEARYHRLAPGQGTLDLGNLMSALPDAAISVEAPNRTLLKEIGPYAFADELLRRTNRLLGRILADSPVRSGSEDRKKLCMRTG